MPMRSRHHWRVLPLTISLCLSACVTGDQHKLTSAVATPLTDLNLVQNRIPEALMVAKQEPYRVPADQSCESLTDQIDALDEALGADLDKDATLADPGLIERGTTMAHDEAFAAITRTVEGVVPFRSWVRKVTGSERHSKRIAAAIAAGGIRRAFLKGIRVARLCQIPAVVTSDIPTTPIRRVSPSSLPKAVDVTAAQSQPTVCDMPKLHKRNVKGKQMTADVKCQSQPNAPVSPTSPAATGSGS